MKINLLRFSAMSGFVLVPVWHIRPRHEVTQNARLWRAEIAGLALAESLAAFVGEVGR